MRKYIKNPYNMLLKPSYFKYILLRTLDHIAKIKSVHDLDLIVYHQLVLRGKLDQIKPSLLLVLLSLDKLLIQLENIINK